MESSSIEAIAVRLDALQRTNSRLRLTAVGLAVGLIGLAMAAAPPRGGAGRTIEAGQLVLRDKEGRVRGSFGVDRSGLPSLKLFDRRGLVQIALGIPLDDMAALSFSDRGSDRVVLTTSIEGATSLRLYDGSEREKAALFLEPDDRTGLRLVGEGGTATVSPGPVDQVPVVTTEAPRRGDG